MALPNSSSFVDAPAGVPHASLTPVEPTVQAISLMSYDLRENAERAAPIAPDDLADNGVADNAAGAAELVVATDEIETDPFRLVAVTWAVDAGAPVAWVRTRSGGEWSKWYRLPGDDEHGPDPASQEADARAGTDPLVVPNSDAVQVRVISDDGEVPFGLRLDLVDPGQSPADAAVGEPTAQAAATAVSPPTIHTRAQWGADESIREPGPPDYGIVNGAFVHHTVNANSYSAAEVPAIIRGIYAYHVNSRGWRDIGYNFLVDRFGRIWEGRYGGVTRAVIGAHTQGYNDDAFAMSAIGTYTNQVPSSALLAAYQRLFSWKFYLHGVDPSRPVNYDGETWPAIAGHRDAAATQCPGSALYARLATIRAGVVAMTPTPSVHAWGWRDLNGDRLSDLVARRTTDGALQLWPGLAQSGYGQPVQVGSGWHNMNTIVRPGDWNGDRRPDVIARVRSNGVLMLYSGNGRGGLTAAGVIGSGWGNAVRILTPGDWNGDGDADLIATFRDGSMWLYPGTGTGGFRPSVRIGHGWVTSIIAAPGDWTGDGAADLLTVASDHSLWLYPGSGGGGFRQASRIGSGWHNFDEITGAGDANNDVRADLLAWTPGGDLWLFRGNGRGGFGSSNRLSGGWTVFDQRS